MSPSRCCTPKDFFVILLRSFDVCSAEQKIQIRREIYERATGKVYKKPGVN